MDSNLQRSVSAQPQASDDDQFLLATLPPSKAQIRLALGIIVALVVAVFVMAPFANIRLPQLGAFYPVLLTAIITADLITSALLFSQFFVVGRTALLVLAITFLFTGLMMIPFMLVFPGAFSSTGLLGAGLQSATWLGSFYRVGSSLGIIAYALLRNSGSTTRQAVRSPLFLISWSVAAVIAIVCGLTWFATAKESLLPTVFLDDTRANRSALILQALFLMSLLALALGLLWTRRRSVLDLWLMVMCCTWLLFLAMSSIIIDTRFTVGWYGIRGYELIAIMVVLLALLSETTALYAKLGRSVIRERGARVAREADLEAMGASIAHELRQPLTAILNNANACLGLISDGGSGMDEMRGALADIVNGAELGGAIIERVRGMAKRSLPQQIPLRLSDVVKDILALTATESAARGIVAHTAVSADLPLVQGDRVQLQQVLLNLVMNGMDAMSTVTDRERGLDIIGWPDTQDGQLAVRISVRDCGIGLNAGETDKLFQAFYTTKPHGMGLGLAISRSIIEAHGGRLWAESNDGLGASFVLRLPAISKSE